MSCQTSAFLTIRKLKFHDWNSFLRVVKDFFSGFVASYEKADFQTITPFEKNSPPTTRYP